MSLQTAKRVYYLSIIVLASALICTGGIVEWAVAIVMLVGALPLLKATIRAAQSRKKEEILKELADHLVPRPYDRGTPQCDQQAPDRRSVGRL